MNPLAERDAEILLQQQARRSKALSILKDRRYPWTASLANSIAWGVCIWVISAYEAPVGVKMLIAIGSTGFVAVSMEVYFLQRRLNATAELLQQCAREKDWD